MASAEQLKLVQVHRSGGGYCLVLGKKGMTVTPKTGRISEVGVAERIFRMSPVDEPWQIIDMADAPPIIREASERLIDSPDLDEDEI